MDLASAVLQDGIFPADTLTRSPSLTWSGTPAGTHSFALLMMDVTPGVGQEMPHWVLYNIPATVNTLAAGLARNPLLRGVGQQGVNFFNETGYQGPVPLADEANHTYRISLYALSCEPNLPPNLTGMTLLQHIQNDLLEETFIEAVYARTFTLASPDIKPNQPLALVHTRDGLNQSPALLWTNPPMGTQRFAVLAEDYTARPFTLWSVYDIPPHITRLAPAQPRDLTLQGIGMQGHNDANQMGYDGPLPDASEERRVRFRVYALSGVPDLEPGMIAGDIRRAILPHFLAQAELEPRYRRTFTLFSPDFEDRRLMPAIHKEQSPRLRWRNVPQGTRSLAMVLKVPQHPPERRVTWMVYNIQPGLLEIPSNLPPYDRLEGLGAQGVVLEKLESLKEDSLLGYSRPRPPWGITYNCQFRLYALDFGPNLPLRLAPERLESLIQGHILAVAELTGLLRG